MSTQLKHMFTGLVEETGRIVATEPRMLVRCAVVLEDLKEGDSVSVNGVCLTAAEVGPDGFTADLAPETKARSTLGKSNAGDLVNLERALRADQRLGGHLVQGHVDGKGEIIALKELTDGNWWLDIRIPQELDRYIVFKGSITIDGISLTVASIKNQVVGITIIPHTYAHTALREKSAGSPVNLEVDILAKYIEKLAVGYQK